MSELQLSRIPGPFDMGGKFQTEVTSAKRQAELRGVLADTHPQRDQSQTTAHAELTNHSQSLGTLTSVHTFLISTEH